jgi:hypothetical protein
VRKATKNRRGNPAGLFYHFLFSFFFFDVLPAGLFTLRIMVWASGAVTAAGTVAVTPRVTRGQKS